MLFVSPGFLVLFTIVYLVYWLVRPAYRKIVLIASSLVFYASWSIPFALHFLLLVFFNYYAIRSYLHHRHRVQFFLIQAINVLNLAFFKYFYFVADTIARVWEIPAWSEAALRSAHQDAGMEILLPLAISFYTFEMISYGVDQRRGSYTRQHSFSDVLLFASFFPRMIAGPIMRPADLLPQITGLAENVRPDRDNVARGSWLILIGIIKKLFVADSLQAVLLPVMASAQGPTAYLPHDLWLVMLGLLIVLYADFSAYSDLARGLAFLLGIRIPTNFRAPFRMHSFTDLWKRWHLTFSSWIRDYIFIPLGGSRCGEARLYFNLMLTFLLAGLWHGASLTFLLWGFLMGFLLSIEAFLARRGFPDLPASKPARVVRVSLVWIIYLSTGILFFAPTWEWALKGFVHLFDVRAYAEPHLQLRPDHRLHVLGAFLAVAVFQAFEEWPSFFVRLRRFEAWLLPILATIVAIGLTQMRTQPKDFFYFRF